MTHELAAQGMNREPVGIATREQSTLWARFAAAAGQYAAIMATYHKPKEDIGEVGVGAWMVVQEEALDGVTPMPRTVRPEGITHWAVGIDSKGDLDLFYVDIIGATEKGYHVGPWRRDTQQPLSWGHLVGQNHAGLTPDELYERFRDRLIKAEAVYESRKQDRVRAAQSR